MNDLRFEHDEKTGKKIVDESGRSILRKEFCIWHRNTTSKNWMRSIYCYRSDQRNHIPWQVCCITCLRWIDWRWGISCWFIFLCAVTVISARLSGLFHVFICNGTIWKLIGLECKCLVICIISGTSILQKLSKVIKEYNSDCTLDYATVQETLGWWTGND